LKGGVIVTEADLRIVTEAEVVEVENAPFDVENGAAVFDYFSAPYFEDGMTGKVLVIPRGPRHGDDDDDDDRVTICHIPPGNPSAAHTIRVGRAAVAAHLAHGDVLGRCDDRDDDDDDDDDDD
jgi:hypothetical protein